MGLYHPSAFFVKVDPAPIPCPPHWGSRASTEERSRKCHPKHCCGVLCVRNPWSQPSSSGMLPHTWLKDQHWPSQKNFFPRELPNPANPEGQGEKGSKMETWKEVPLPSLKGQNLKAGSFFLIVCLMLNNQLALPWCYNCLLFTEMWWPHNKPSFMIISSLLLSGGAERTLI